MFYDSMIPPPIAGFIPSLGLPAGGYAQGLDIVAHEFTHGVTEFSSSLIYAGESGEINEALSDIFGAAVTAWVTGQYTNSTTFTQGENIQRTNSFYGPDVQLPPPRYMYNPTLDGKSADYYPDVLAFAAGFVPSSDNDYGYVHSYSGIANLAFVLMVKGGTHPRNKTSINVPQLDAAGGLAGSMDRAQRIFYRANTMYLGPGAQYSDLRLATAQAAQDLYGSTVATNVELAWDAVGVPALSGNRHPVNISSRAKYHRRSGG
jgi:vibriolysin